MRNTPDLADTTCDACQGGLAAMDSGAAQGLLAELHSDWQLDQGATSLTRRLVFKGFAKAVYHANLAAWLGDNQGHHPDISFGWGYCQIVFTTHDAGGLSQNDFICAAKLDRLLTAGGAPD